MFQPDYHAEQYEQYAPRAYAATSPQVWGPSPYPSALPLSSHLAPRPRSSFVNALMFLVGAAVAIIAVRLLIIGPSQAREAAARSAQAHITVPVATPAPTTPPVAAPPVLSAQPPVAAAAPSAPEQKKVVRPLAHKARSHHAPARHPRAASASEGDAKPAPAPAPAAAAPDSEGVPASRD